MNYLIYINGLGPNYKGDNIYEFIFSDEQEVWGEGWDSKPCNGYPFPPELKYIKKEIKINKRKGYYYEKDNIIYFKKNSFKLYFEKEFNIITYRQPDEAYLIKKDDKYILKILEKKNGYYEYLI